MCGIFGFICREERDLVSAELANLVRSFFILSESRGREASGIALAQANEISVLKRDLRGKEFIRLQELKKMVGQRQNGPMAFMGHTRMVTSGDASLVGDNQPVVRNSIVCIHNGIITNETALWANNPDLLRNYTVDTEIFLALVERRLLSGFGLGNAARFVANQLEGANTFAVMGGGSDSLCLVTVNGSLYFAANEKSGIGIFASERFILEQVTRRNSWLEDCELSPISQVVPGAGLLFSLSGEFLQEFFLCDGDDLIETNVNRAVFDCGSRSSTGRLRPRAKNKGDVLRIEKSMKVDFGAIQRIRRCTKCLLPETFPFIQFDAAGTCNVCLHHERRSQVPEENLRDLLQPSGDSDYDCLVPISGGRDSCYTLHYLVNEMGLSPVAFTYDWGMVTDLARRNISRMCGALGVEHILVSADIERKRRFIRKNVSAWLKRPHLGTIPLFMAGDKQFFYYAEKIKRQMGLGSIVFSQTQLERTDFKVGFCGIDENYDRETYYDSTWRNKIRLVMFYGAEYLKNPYYWNGSIFDTMTAYASYYMLPKKYFHFFDYVEWDEAVVTSTLIDQYNWELAPDTVGTWRIGDGTAAFYNYIYLKVAGFTENDTFRSNQIREGLIEREEALSRVQEENIPRAPSVEWYFDTIGMDALEVIRKVNSMPQLYG